MSEYRPEDYAADPAVCGNGVTDDTDAFAAMSSAINAVPDRRTVIVLTSSATYRLGRQTLSGSVTAGGSYKPVPGFSLRGLDHVLIEGRGARLRYNDGLRIGTFDPVTGAAHGTSGVAIGASGNSKYVAAPGDLLKVASVGSIIIRDVELDGNDTAFVRGGGIGIAGSGDYSCAATGIHLSNSSQVTLDNVTVHHVPLDGVAIHDGSATPGSTGHVSLRSVDVTYVGRNGLWLSGTRNVHAMACYFGHTGRGVFATAPGVGIDFEAYSPSGGQNAVFEACEISDNASRGYSVSSGWKGITFTRCVFRASGTRGEFATPVGARVTHEDCDISGFINLLGSDPTDPDSELRPHNATQFRRCVIEDADYVEPVTFIDHAGVPTLRAEARQSYGSRPLVIRVEIKTASTLNRWRCVVLYDGVAVEDYDNLNTVAGALAALAASNYVVFTNLGSSSSNPTGQPAVSGVDLPVRVLSRVNGGLVVKAVDNAVFEDCTFIPHAVAAFTMSKNTTLTAPMRIRRCTVVPYRNDVADKGRQSTLRQVHLDGLAFVEPPGLIPPANGWYVSTDNSVELGAHGVTVGPSIRWGSWDGPTGTITGES